MLDQVQCRLEVHKAHKEWLLVLACLVHQYSEICVLVSCPLPHQNPACSSAVSVSVFTKSDPLQYDPKKDLACM